MALNPRCKMLIKEILGGVRGKLGNNEIDKAQAMADITKSLVDIGRLPTLRESAGSLIRNNFLSATSTTIKNFMGNLARVIEAPLTRFASGLATADAKKLREAGDILVGYTKAFAEVFPRFIGGFQNKNIVFDGRTSKQVDFYIGMPGADPTKELSTFDKGLNAVVTFPQSLQRGIDEGFSTFFERAQYQVLLNRLKNAPDIDALNRLGISRDELVERLEKGVTSRAAGGLRDVREERLLDAVTKIDPEAGKLIEEFALYGTFRSKLGEGLIDQAASKWFTFGNKFIPELQALVTPFIITPLNVAKFGSGFVPGLGVARMSRASRDLKKLDLKRMTIQNKINDTIAKLDPDDEYTYSQLVTANVKNSITIRRLKKQLAEVDGEIAAKKQLKNDFIGQQLLGLGFSGWAYSMIQDGSLTGDYPADPAARARMQEQGFPPNSVKIGDRWISYTGIEPLHTVLAIFANGKQKADDQRLRGEDGFMDTMASVANVVKNAFLDKTFTAQLADLMNAATAEDGSKMDYFAVSMTNGLTPNLLNMIARIEDPVRKQIKDPELQNWILNNMKARIPGLRQQLPDRVSPVTGEPISLGTTAEISTGFKFSEVNRTAVQELFDNPALKIAPPSSDLYGIKLNAEQYARMTKIMGDFTNKTLDALASSEGFMLLPQSLQAKAIKDAVGSIRSDVRRMILGELIQDKGSEEYRAFMINEFTKKGLNPHTNPNIVID